MSEGLQLAEHSIQVGDSEILITNRSLSELGIPVDVLVSSDDNYLSHGGGVSLALWQGAGESEIAASVAAQSDKWALGDVVVTVAGRLQAKAIFHAVTVDFDSNRRLTQPQLSELYTRVFELSEQHGHTAVGLPLVASGAGRITPQVSASLLARAIQDSIAGPSALSRIIVSAPAPNFSIACDAIGPLVSLDTSFAQIRSSANRMLTSGMSLPAWLVTSLQSLLEIGTASHWPSVVAHLLDQAHVTMNPGDLPPELWSRASMVRNRLAHGSRQPRWTAEVTGALLSVLQCLERSLPPDQGRADDDVPTASSLARLAVEMGGLHKKFIHPARGPLFDLQGPSDGASVKRPPEPVVAARPAEEVVAVPEGSHVRRLHRLLLDQLAKHDELKSRIDRLLLKRGYQGEFELRLLEHCIRIDEPADLLSGTFDLPTLHVIYEQVVGQSSDDAADSAELVREILSAVGFPSATACHGPKQVREIIDRSEQLVRVKGLSAASSVVHDVARQLEYLCHVLLRFICRAAFSEAPEIYLRSRGSISKPGDLVKSGLGPLLIYCEQVIDDLRTTEAPQALVLQRDLGETSLPKGKDALTGVRNSFSHFKPGAPVASEADALGFLHHARQLLVALARPEGRLLPFVVTIQSLEIDRWGRRTVRALNDEGMDETLFTDEPVRPGETYLMYPLSNPLRVDPILVPAGDVIWKD
ncbi:MAG: macro domain-containing protein [Acidobacteriota bacterium]|nr:macro domain-containing protein [Acidobacteriota bacterium]